MGCSSLASLEIPSSVTSIGNFAFYGCSSLTSIAIPSSVTSIGDYAFSKCSSLASLEIPSSVTSIGNGAFNGCSSLASLEIPSSVTSIGYFAFERCGSLTSLVIPPITTATGVTQSNARELNKIPIDQNTRVWAPDAVIAELKGPYEAYNTFADIPRPLREAPYATTWAGVQLWMHWSDPETDAAEKRVLKNSRKWMVWTVKHIAERLEILPDELWLLIFTFVKHE